LIFNYYFKEETISVLVITEGEKLMKRQKENVERENSLQITVHMLVVTRKLLGGIWLRKISYLIVLQGRNQFKIV
jgi:hypothetical protein